MRFKTDRIRAEWFGASGFNGARVSARMKEIALDGIILAENLGWDPVVTCVLRTPIENDLLYGGRGDHTTGVHVDGRGVDLRTADASPAAVAAVVARINEDWIYDPKRPKMLCALLEGEGPGSSAPHLHLQVHPATVERTYPAAALSRDPGPA